MEVVFQMDLFLNQICTDFPRFFPFVYSSISFRPKNNLGYVVMYRIVDIHSLTHPNNSTIYLAKPAPPSQPGTTIPRSPLLPSYANITKQVFSQHLNQLLSSLRRIYIWHIYPVGSVIGFCGAWVNKNNINCVVFFPSLSPFFFYSIITISLIFPD